jgi:protocatechuate 3,4-dioxygenase beta subunit
MPDRPDPPLDFPDYTSTRLRAPKRPFVRLPIFDDVSAPVFGRDRVGDDDNDLTLGGAMGERIVVSGRIVDSRREPVRNALVEIWQANAAGRYAHAADNHDAPLDPNFSGFGRCLTDGEGWYRFVTIKPGAYPWQNHQNAWRPAHIHFSLFGTSFTERLVTQMYFPGDPLHRLDPILNSVAYPDARDALVASFDIETTKPEWALGYRWDIVL